MYKLLIFNDEQLLRRALTHSSYVNEHPELEDNERLEWLGDAIYKQFCSLYLYQRSPKMTEGELTEQRKRLEKNKQLAQFAIQIGLGSKMYLGKGEIPKNGHPKPKLLSGAFEAVVGAYFLDKNRNYEALFLLLKELFDSVSLNTNIDPKNLLQEFSQKEYQGEIPTYTTTKNGGKEHKPEYVSQVSIDNQFYGEGKGNSKKEAENNAASDALTRI